MHFLYENKACVILLFVNKQVHILHKFVEIMFKNQMLSLLIWKEPFIKCQRKQPFVWCLRWQKRFLVCY